MKFTKLLSTILITVGLAGCSLDNIVKEPIQTNGEMFEIICMHAYNDPSVGTGWIKYVRDNNTYIMYIYKQETGFSGYCPYYETSGRPMTYMTFKRVHTEKYHSDDD